MADRTANASSADLLHLTLSEKGPSRTRAIVGTRADFEALRDATDPLPQEQMTRLFDLLDARYPVLKIPADPIPMRNVIGVIEELPVVFPANAAASSRPSRSCW